MTILTALVGLAILIGLIGIVVPVLPGSLLIGASVLVWAILAGSPAGWAGFGIAAVLLSCGIGATYLLTATRTKAHGVPSRAITIAGLAGIVGFFVIPVIGLPLGFAIGLMLLEYYRLRDWSAALRSAVVAVKAVGLGMLIELTCGLLAAGIWLAVVLWWQ